MEVTITTLHRCETHWHFAQVMFFGFMACADPECFVRVGPTLTYF